MINAVHFPSLNAALNLIAGIFLAAGFYFIKRGDIIAHKRCMLAAFCTSVVFLISYLYYHANFGSTKFQGTGGIRTVYFAILITHTILAAAIVPMILTTLSRAFKGRFDLHQRIARFTWPMWMYVSVTGVVIYVMLYWGPGAG